MVLSLLGCNVAVAQQSGGEVASFMESLRSGDLLFVCDRSGMGRAVQQATGAYTHVALVERMGDSVYIIDATPLLGVARRPISSLLDLQVVVDAYRLTIPFDSNAVIARAHALLGRPYDNAFLPDNDAYYCSELIQAVFLVEGRPLFESSPMNWRDSKGRLPLYWRRHFKKIGMSVPEWVPGTNPSDLSRSPLLRALK